MHRIPSLQLDIRWPVRVSQCIAEIGGYGTHVSRIRVLATYQNIARVRTRLQQKFRVNQIGEPHLCSPLIGSRPVYVTGQCHCLRKLRQDRRNDDDIAGPNRGRGGGVVTNIHRQYFAILAIVNTLDARAFWIGIGG